jgi:hypothetical protein
MLIVSFTLARAAVPAERVTEGLTWATFAANLSYSGSTAVAGAVISTSGVATATLVPIAAGIAAFAVAAATVTLLPHP